MFVNYFSFDFFIDTEVLAYFALASLIGLYLKIIINLLIDSEVYKTITSFLTFVLLPPIGYLITEVISSNIALSLGMVGALSIVRFRTPVKSPLELVNYFMLITIGIVLNANPNYAINFCIYLAVATLVFKLLSYSLKNNFTYKFLVDDSISSSFNLSVTTKNKIDTEKFSDYLKHESSDGDNYLYIFTSKNKKVINEIFEDLNSDEALTYSIDN